VSEKIKQFFRLGYVNDVSLYFRVHVTSTNLAKELVDIVGRYNDFDQEKVKACLDVLKGKVSGYELGRECSPVIHIELPYWTHQREGNQKRNGERIPESETKKLVEEMRHMFKDVRLCDEFDILGLKEHHVRVWWD